MHFFRGVVLNAGVAAGLPSHLLLPPPLPHLQAVYFSKKNCAILLWICFFSKNNNLHYKSSHLFEWLPMCTLKSVFVTVQKNMLLTKFFWMSYISIFFLVIYKNHLIGYLQIYFSNLVIFSLTKKFVLIP